MQELVLGQCLHAAESLVAQIADELEHIGFFGLSFFLPPRQPELVQIKRYYESAGPANPR